jgi:hypothetical protein
LVAASIVSLFAVIENTYLISISFWIFAVVFVADNFRYAAERGYIETLFSSKFIPSHYGPVRPMQE